MCTEKIVNNTGKCYFASRKFSLANWAGTVLHLIHQSGMTVSCCEVICFMPCMLIGHACLYSDLAKLHFGIA